MTAPFKQRALPHIAPVMPLEVDVAVNPTKSRRTLPFRVLHSFSILCCPLCHISLVRALCSTRFASQCGRWRVLLSPLYYQERAVIHIPLYCTFRLWVCIPTALKEP
ncbi:hypothetical protein, unlikely [Trypanosoma brucei gambiense DAL972]|uniref:Uncharacterized protein n=1 Tax=Trypanosoma brucei gambiense (strain MHOM/CI/86/DAL972) TaxID=679716 RepID=C9ZSX2_TRYB9|nr:hypothetical protein, unlikely [Trypanosoma brucei gambiense DAL972]CBH12507.1 hypothetical protein, unlikely [Trypanosoma brucei gambiense DAL972]|eukprot:XP_011774787.1 hypothetical protein, unlikely [Trypanosoma brucei gambiense DAL972]